MNLSTIAHLRLYHQQLSDHTFTTPAEVVSWLGAVQSQEYPGGKWAVAQRIPGMTDEVVEQAFTNGEILRTHVLRPTWHFVTPADIRWMLKLTAPHIKRQSAAYFRQQGLNEETFMRSHDLIAAALEGGKQLTKVEVRRVLEEAGVDAGSNLRLSFLLFCAELDGVVCSGARRGNRQTYALLEERVPPAPELTREEALAALALRYFSSHGPATIKDYAWWSGLPMADARAGLEMVKSELTGETVEGKVYWFREAVPLSMPDTPTAYLLPNFDEYLVGYAYADRHITREPDYNEPLEGWGDWGNIINFNAVAINDKVVGTWKAALKKKQMIIERNLFRPLTKIEEDAFFAAIERYRGYSGTEVNVV